VASNPDTYHLNVKRGRERFVPSAEIRKDVRRAIKDLSESLSIVPTAVDGMEN